MSDGRSIRLFLADGTPGGLLTAEIMNWTGHVAAAPRSDLAALLQRPETARTGIYILLGDDPETFGGTLAYIGEGDEVRTRLKQHARAEEQGGKDFRDRAAPTRRYARLHDQVRLRRDPADPGDLDAVPAM